MVIAPQLDDVKQESRGRLPADIVAFIDECMKEKHSDGKLLMVLHKIQDKFSYVSREHMDAVAHLMQIPTTKIYGVVTFYHYFRLKPIGKHVINVCTGATCFLNGSQELVDEFKRLLNIKVGETTSDGLFTLETGRCFGSCTHAPFIKIDDKLFPKVLPEQVPLIIAQYRQESGEKAIKSKKVVAKDKK